MNKKIIELTNRVNSILEKIWHWWEFWIICANDTWYTVYAEEICFNIKD